MDIIFDISDLRDVISILKKYNNENLINELKENLIFSRDIYNISEILEIFLTINYDYFLEIGYIKEY